MTKPGLAERFAEHDVIVNCAGPGYQLEAHAVRAAVAAGVNYVSLCDDHDGAEQALAHDPLRRPRNHDHQRVRVEPRDHELLGASRRRRAGRGARDPHRSAASSADSEGYASAQHLVHALSQDAPFSSEGTVASQKAGTAPKLVYFPDPVGWVETFVCGHPELSTIPRSSQGSLHHAVPYRTHGAGRHGPPARIARDGTLPKRGPKEDVVDGHLAHAWDGREDPSAWSSVDGCSGGRSRDGRTATRRSFLWRSSITS